MDPEKHRAIASMGGRAAHQFGVAHEFTSEEARIAGAKGGKANKNRYRFKSEAARAAMRQALEEIEAAYCRRDGRRGRVCGLHATSARVDEKASKKLSAVLVAAGSII
jgi:hypothetical protein